MTRSWEVELKNGANADKLASKYGFTNDGLVRG
jgi:hypothetical protein